MEKVIHITNRDDDKPCNPNERVTIDWAIDLLMPDEDVVSCISEGTTSLNALAIKFGVSVDNAKSKVKRLGYKTVK